MKKFTIAIIFLLVSCAHLKAQDTSLSFLYITKDYHTKVNPLIEEIKDIYNFVLEDRSCSAIFYLPDRDAPIIVKVNLPGDNHKDMDLIYSALSTKSETDANPSVDLKKISTLFEEHPLLSLDGRPMFTDVELRFYVNPSFWALFYNEQVIASLWFILELDGEWSRNYVSMSIFHQDGDGIQVNPQAPFGPKNLCSNYKFHLLTY